MLDYLAILDPIIKPMFGCYAIYIGEKIMLVLRDREVSTIDNGIWIATTPEHHSSLKKEFRSLRSISIFGPRESGWQVVPTKATDFEEATIRICELILKGDHRIGKVPKSKIPKVRKKLE